LAPRFSFLATGGLVGAGVVGAGVAEGGADEGAVEIGALGAGAAVSEELPESHPGSSASAITTAATTVGDLRIARSSRPYCLIIPENFSFRTEECVEPGQPGLTADDYPISTSRSNERWTPS
jgi:hypothetical protein